MLVVEHGQIVESISRAQMADASVLEQAASLCGRLRRRVWSGEKGRETVHVGHHLARLLAQLLVGSVNGAFYALLSLGMAIILGLLKS